MENRARSGSNDVLGSPSAADASFSEKIVRCLEFISLTGRNFETTKDNMVTMGALNDFIANMEKQMLLFMTIIEESNDKRVSELKDIVKREIETIRGLCASSDTVPTLRDKCAEAVLPCVMSIAAATKYYFSLKASDNTQKSSQDIDKVDDQKGTGRSQTTLDILAFTKTCTKLSVYVKSANIDKSKLLGYLQTILTYIKKFTSDDNFAKVIGPDAVGKFLDVVRDIKTIQDMEELDTKLVEALLVALTPLAAGVKTAAFSIHKSGSENSLRSVGKKSYDANLDNITALETQASTKKSQDKSDLAQPFKSLGSDSNLSDVASFDMETSPALPRKTETVNSAKTPVSPSSSVSSSLSKLPSESQKSPERNMHRVDSSFSLMSISTQNTVFAVRSIIPTSVDISPTIGENNGSKYAVVLDIIIARPRTGEETKSLRKTDKEIRSLSEQLMIISPNTISPVVEFTGDTPTGKEINTLLDQSKKLFAAVSQSSAILKSQPVINFVSDGLFLLELTTPKIPTTPTPGNSYASLRGAEPEALFFSPSTASTVSRYSVYQVDPEDGKSKSVETATFSRTSKFFTFRGSKYLGTVKDVGSRNTSEMDITGGGSKADISNDSENHFGTLSWQKSSKLFSFSGASISRNSISELRPKSDPVIKRGARDSIPEFRERGLSMNKKKFDIFLETHKEKGFAKTAEDTLTLSKDGKELMIVKNINGSPKISACEMELLVETILTNEPFQDAKLVECFLITYRHFMKPHELLIKIVEKYKECAANDTGDAGKLQISSFVSLWVSLSWDDFDKDPNLQSILTKFIEIIKNTKKASHMAPQIVNTMEAQKKSFAEIRQRAAEKEQSIKGLISNVGVAEFATLDVQVLAEQMTKIDFELFNAIKAVDFAEHIWTKEARIASIDTWVSRFNLISFWVATEICTVPILKARVTILENMIKLLKALKELNNYNAVMALVSGLNSASVRRLKKTWEALNPKLQTVLNEMEKIMDPQFNYQSYRDHENKFKNQSFVPFLGLYLKDLTFANDGNPKILSNGLINFSKNWTIFDIITRIRQFQEIQYEIEENQKYYDFCKKLISLPEKRLYSYSLLCEPKSNKEVSGTDTVRLIEKWSTSK